MIHIITQPSTNYYIWQVELVINSIIEHCTYDSIHIVGTHKNSDKWDDLETKYPIVSFYYYDDTRLNPQYIPSIRPHILEKHFNEYPDLSQSTIFYHDCDILFTKTVDYSHLEDGDTWFLSDTISYIGFDYIKSKGDDVLDLMCNVCDISSDTIKNNQENSGGAQYIMKNVDSDFWSDVYMDCENLFIEVSKMNHIKKNLDPNYHEIQIWCADMWAVLWNAWKRNFETKCVKELDFSWSTSHVNQWDKKSIYHNAGVLSGDDTMFFKGNYIYNLPKDLNLVNLNENVCAFNYYNYIKTIQEKVHYK